MTISRACQRAVGGTGEGIQKISLQFKPLVDAWGLWVILWREMPLGLRDENGVVCLNTYAEVS